MTKDVTVAVLLIAGQSAATVVFCTTTVMVPFAARLAAVQVSVEPVIEQPVTAGLIVQPVPGSVSHTVTFGDSSSHVFAAVLVNDATPPTATVLEPATFVIEMF